MNKQAMKNSTEYPSRLAHGALTNSSLWKKLKLWLRDYKWPLIGLMWAVAIALGYIGFSKHFSAIGEACPFWHMLYLTVQLFVLESGEVLGPANWALTVARILAPAVAIYTTIEALAIILHEQFQRFRMRFLKDHIVVCGLGQKGLLLSRSFRESGEQVVVIEQDGGNSMLEQCREYGVMTLIGNATDSGMLRRAQVHKAKYIISVCGNDGTNAEVATRARDLVWGRKGKALSCLVHIFDPQLYNLLREREMGMGKLGAFRLESFNVFESGARVLLNEYPPFSKTGKEHSPGPHIVVVGVGRMGESMVVNAARNWQERGNASGERLRITLIDKEAERKKESLCFRYPQLERVCELVPGQMDVKNPEFERAEFLFDCRGYCDVSMIYVCLDDDSAALGAALMLRQRVRPVEIPIVVRMTHDAGLATLLPEKRHKGESFVNVHAFGLLDRTCTPDLLFGCTYEILARAIHEHYLRSEQEKGSTTQTNPSMVPWEELPENLRQSNRGQAEHIRVMLQAIGCDIAITNDWDVQPFLFSPEEVELMAKVEHERFVEERLREGFKYGPVKDLKKKANPNLVSWNELPNEEKNKDRNSVRNLPALLARARFQIYRLRRKE
jgi:hypothetical protein